MERLVELKKAIVLIQSEYMFKDNQYYNEKGTMGFKNTKVAKEIRARMKVAYREFYKAFDEYEKENHLTWDYEDWITDSKYHIYSNVGMEYVRKQLLEKLSQMNGVNVEEEKSGVKIISVKTKTKVYKYCIHAFYCVNPNEYDYRNGLDAYKNTEEKWYGACVITLNSGYYNYSRDKFEEIVLTKEEMPIYQ